MDNFIKQIKHSNLFNNVTEDDIKTLLDNVNYKVMHLVKNQYVFDSFTNSNYIGIVISGKLDIEKILPCGKAVFMYSKKNGDIFGEVAAFSKTEYYPCNVISKTESSLIIFEKSQFLKLLMFNSIVITNFLKLVCNKTLSLNKRVDTLSFTSAKEKICHSILYDFDMDDNLYIKLPFNKQCWANTLNISRASLYRELTNLCDSSLISFTKPSVIKILDIQTLRNTIIN